MIGVMLDIEANARYCQIQRKRTSKCLPNIGGNKNQQAIRQPEPAQHHYCLDVQRAEFASRDLVLLDALLHAPLELLIEAHVCHEPGPYDFSS